MPFSSAISSVPQIGFDTGAPAVGGMDLNVSRQSEIASAAARDFEAFVLQSFIESMLPEKSESVFGTGRAAAFWKSMLAEHVANELAHAGGIGIARLVEAELAERSGDES